MVSIVLSQQEGCEFESIDRLNGWMDIFTERVWVGQFVDHDLMSFSSHSLKEIKAFYQNVELYIYTMVQQSCVWQVCQKNILNVTWAETGFKLPEKIYDCLYTFC